MRSRNTHRLPEAGGSGLHSDGHQSLLRKLRDFVACQCREDGRASTGEILTGFAGELSPSQSAVFRSMLRQICDFHRHQGEGIWTLKAEFRWFHALFYTYSYFMQSKYESVAYPIRIIFLSLFDWFHTSIWHFQYPYNRCSVFLLLN